MDLFGILSWLGVGGVAGVIAVAYLMPNLLPAFAIGMLRAVGEIVAGGVQYVGSLLLAGGQVIFANRAATFTLLFATLVGGWAGDRYEFVRPYVPGWLQSEPGQVKAARTQERARVAKAPARKAAAKPKRTTAFDDILCNITGNC